MSKLANLIEVQQTGRIKLHPGNPVIEVVDGLNTVLDLTKMAMVEYHLQVRMGAKGYADPNDGAEILHLKDMCKRQILEEVFGEFRPMLRKLERAIYEMNYDDARTALQEIELEMRY